MGETEFLRRIFLKCELPQCIDKIKEIINYDKNLEKEENIKLIEKLKEELFEMTSDGTLKDKIEKEIAKKGKNSVIKSLLEKLVIKEAEPLTYIILLEFSDEDLIKNAIEILEETDLENVSNAVLKFLEKKKNVILPFIEEFFDSKDSNLIMKGIKIAAKIKTEGMKKRLEEFLKSSNMLIQREALLALIEIDDEDSLEILKRNFLNLMGKEQLEALRFINEKKDKDFIRKLKGMDELRLNKELYSMIEKYDSSN